MEPNDFYKNSNLEIVHPNKTNYVGKRHQRLQEKIDGKFVTENHVENQEHIKSINMSNQEEFNELGMILIFKHHLFVYLMHSLSSYM
jgi:hypothetical protein